MWEKLSKGLFAPVLLTVISIGIIIFCNVMLDSTYNFTVTIVLLILCYVFLELFGFFMDSAFFSLSDQNIVILLFFYGLQYGLIAILISNIPLSIYKYFNQKSTSLFRMFYVNLYNIGTQTIGWAVVAYFFKFCKLDLSQLLSIGVIEVFIIGYLIYSIGMVTLIASLEKGIIDNEFKSGSGYIFYTAALCLISLLLFKQAGVAGLILLYCVFIPVKMTAESHTIMQQQQKELFTDDLTKVNNYKFFNEVVDNKIMKKRPFCLFMTDLNKFKLINDTYGHGAGNKVLIHYADTLVKKLPNGSMVFRFGGDEFIIVADGTQNIVDNIKLFLEDTLKFHVIFNKIRIDYSISYGYSRFDGSQIKQELIETADRSMYGHKGEINRRSLMSYIDVQKQEEIIEHLYQ